MLQDEAVRSAQIYLDYLLAHREEGLGLVRARVRSVQSSLLSGEMVLLVDRVMRSADGLVMRVGGTLYENSADQVCFKVQSLNRRKVVIEPSPELAEHIDAAWENKEPIILETDLTFLVKRVKSWYEKYGNRVSLPVSVLDGTGCRLVADNPIALSDNQYHSASLAMSSPLTYIWGAPGTGKTKHVLASCVLSYIRAGKKVILVAPTNNALEQSLGGLLHALSREGGVDPAGKVICLGVPGNTFHTIWPEICEDGAANWMKMDISERVNVLQYQNHLIDESLSFREGKAKDGASDSWPEKSVEELRREKKQNTASLNQYGGQPGEENAGAHRGRGGLERETWPADLGAVRRGNGDPAGGEDCGKPGGAGGNG